MDTNTPPGSSLRAGRREWVGLAVPTLLQALDFSVLYLARPRHRPDRSCSPLVISRFLFSSVFRAWLHFSWREQESLLLAWLRCGGNRAVTM